LVQPLPVEHEPANPPPFALPEDEISDDEQDENIAPVPDVETTALPPAAPDEQRTRHGRAVRRPQRLIEQFHLHATKLESKPWMKNDVTPVDRSSNFLQTMTWDCLCTTLKDGTLGDLQAKQQLDVDATTNTVEHWNPMALAVKASTEDNPTWHEAMNGPDKAGYWEAMVKEHTTLEDEMGCWESVNRQSWMNVLPSTWAFRCKRFPDGTIKKLKARFCARGDKQIEGVDFFETFAPVVNWQTVRIMLILSLILKLATKQVDYTAAFIHAPIDKDPEWDKLSDDQKAKSGVFIEMAKGFGEAGKVLKLKKSLYGLKQAPRNFFLHLKSRLEEAGFQQSETDACLFVSDKVICLVYVDDTLLFAPKMEYIDEALTRIRKTMALEEEDDVAGFLGVHIARQDDGTIHMTQKGLTDRIIEALGVAERPSKHTPAEYGCLGSDPDGDFAQSTYSYPSVVGMLQYLQGHSRPDITFAVSQCARYTHSPKRSHEKALERVGQYLKGTRDKGLILRPTGQNNLKIEAYVDADFAGMWGVESPHDPASVKSRTGLVIFISGCPVIWTSKLQTDIATSTMEAEYNALSIAMRDILPLHRLTKEICTSIGVSEQSKATIKTTVYEDNSGALTLAKLEPGRMTPRSKHYGVKYHWFRSQLQPNQIEIEKVESLAQRADMFTKGLRTILFQQNRKLTNGW
jgi:hypothetical protein